MDTRRSTWTAAIRLAIVMSAIAAVMAAVAHSLDISSGPIVLSVIVIGFATSWVRTGQVAHQPVASPHRVARIPVQHRHPV